MIRAVRDGRVMLADKGGAACSAGIEHAAEQALLLFEFDWSLLYCEESFVTSDRAFAIDDPHPPYPWSSQAILSSPFAETTVPLSEHACLLLRPLGRRLAAAEISQSDAERINLRTYGWADRYVFGATQEAVVAVRRAAKARPADVVRPKPQNYVLLTDPDPDDDSFAEANRRRGWPARIEYEGAEHDYVVIPHDGPSAELHAQMDAAVERRARKTLGIGEKATLPGRMETKPVHPLDIEKRRTPSRR